jgi:hypothetical protein
MIYTVMVLVRFKGSCVTLKMVSFMTRVLDLILPLQRKQRRKLRK